MKKSKTFNKWLTRVQDNETPWSENDIIYFRKAVGSSGLKSNDERDELRGAFNSDEGYKITENQTSKGINYLKNTIYKANGSLRNTIKSRAFGLREKAIIDNFSHFLFTDIHNGSSNYYEFYLPVYRVIAKNGSYFEYTTNMGQMVVTG